MEHWSKKIQQGYPMDLIRNDVKNKNGCCSVGTKQTVVMFLPWLVVTSI